jgi:hypothetical protein
LDLDDSTDDGPLTYMLTFALPSVELRFQVSSLDAVQAMSSFFRENYGQRKVAELEIGVLDGVPVRIIKDDEHLDRFFISAARGGMIRVTVVDPVASDLVRAMEELAAEAAAR